MLIDLYVLSIWMTLCDQTAGVQVQPLPAGHTSTLLYFYKANITLEGAPNS